MSVSQPSTAIRRRNRRVDRYRQLVRPIALHYASRCPEPLDDLVQVGLLGLLRAAELFQEGSATPFDAFARPHIRGAILHYLRDRLQPIRLPRRLQEQLDLRRRCVTQARQSSGACPGEAELRGAMGLDRHQWDRLEQARQLNRLVPLGPELEDTMAAPVAQPDEGGREEEQAMAALARLEPALAMVVQRVVLAGWSYRRTASHLDISPMTVQRRLKRGLTQLRQQLLLNPPAAGCRAPSAVPMC